MDAQPRIRLPLSAYLVIFVAPLAFLLIVVPSLFAGSVTHPRPPGVGPVIQLQPALPGFAPGLAEPPAESAPPSVRPAPVPAPAPAPAPVLVAPAAPPAGTEPVPPAAVQPAPAPETVGKSNRGKHLGQHKHHHQSES